MIPQADAGPPLAFALRRFAFAVATLTVLFALPLYHLFRFSLESQLYSHILLVPITSLYVVWQRRASLPPAAVPDRLFAFAFAAAGLAALGAFWMVRSELEQVDAFALTTLAYLFLLAGVCAWCLGRPLLKALAFPLGFLVFMAPFPAFVVSATETVLQHGSALVARGLFMFSSTPVLAEGLMLQLPGIALEVAPECSGIHSSLALFITSIVAGHLLLRSPGKRLVLALAVVPLAFLRNGFRVFVIGELCARMGPDMIHSYIHRRGGPIFFALSLVPFFILLLLLLRSERKALRAAPRVDTPAVSGHVGGA